MDRKITAERLREVLDYDPGTGAWTWLVSLGSRAQAGCRAGKYRMKRGGYRRITIDGTSYLAHRLAWLYVHGEWPSRVIDHRDGDGANNAEYNLREATQSQNCGNSIRSRPGLKGAYWHRLRGRWMAAITVNRKQVHLGYFDSAELAHAAYKNAAIAAFGEFARFS